MATRYDHNILQSYADELYRQALNIASWYALKYGFISFLLSFVVLYPWMTIGLRAEGAPAFLWAALVGAIGAGIGLDAGRSKAFMLKLEAQRILCQASIEMNTRIGAREALAASIS